MIISTTVRDGISEPIQKPLIYQECEQLKNTSKGIHTIHVTFCKSCVSELQDFICCHVSIKCSNKGHFDIFEEDQNSTSAFINAMSKIENHFHKVENINRKLKSVESEEVLLS